MAKRPVYQMLAGKLLAMANCAKRDVTFNADGWYQRHKDIAASFVENEGPSGSGFDGGTTLDFDESTPDKLVFHTAFHHMNAHGFYDRWTEHKVIVKPSLAFGFDLQITGRDRNDIKEYIGHVFHEFLSKHVEG